jgi:hypothetical protein
LNIASKNEEDTYIALKFAQSRNNIEDTDIAIRNHEKAKLYRILVQIDVNEAIRNLQSQLK